ncbi:MAG: phosphatase PAP2 family protein [Chloroflexota bacterium]|nr:phosphatase PAP2 family protein [Chloroflexota bacterium]
MKLVVRGEFTIVINNDRRNRSRQSPTVPAGNLSQAPTARQPAPSIQDPAHPGDRRLSGELRNLLAGSTLLLVVALSLTVAAAGDGVLSADLSIARRIQSADGPVVDALVAAGDLLGSTRVLLGLASIVLLAAAIRRRWADVALVLVAAVSQFLGLLLKAAADSPRPTPDLIRVTAESDGAGFPSRTTMAALLTYGTILYLAVRSPGASRPAVRWPLIVAFALAVLLVGFERIAVGAHWPSDVLGGYLWGGAVLLLLLAAHRRGRAAG